MPTSTSDYLAAANVGIGLINPVLQGFANRAARKYNTEMYERQRADALADWHMQNDYNSPAAQMARLKAGGLNPNLVYGDGANSPSAQIRGSDTGSWRPEAPRLDFSAAQQSVLAATQIRNTEQQTNNLRAQEKLVEQQVLREAAQIQSIGSQTARSNFDLEQLKAKSLTDIEIQKSTLRNLDADYDQKIANTQFTRNQDVRNALLNNQTLQKGFAEIANLRATNDSIRQGIRNQQTQNAIAELDRALKAQNIQPHDPAYIRLGAKALSLVPSPQAFKKWVDSTVSDLYKAAKSKALNYRGSLNR